MREAVIRNELTSFNAVFDKTLYRNVVRYIKVESPFNVGIKTVSRIVAVGSGVAHFREGDAVAASRLGSSYREYQVANANKVIQIRKSTTETLALVPTRVSAMMGLERIGDIR